jgi:hypothetical protein
MTNLDEIEIKIIEIKNLMLNDRAVSLSGELEDERGSKIKYRFSLRG